MLILHTIYTQYFACPEGAKVQMAAVRPDPSLSSFILSGSGDAADNSQQFGACLVLFVKLAVNNHHHKNQSNNNSSNNNNSSSSNNNNDDDNEGKISSSDSGDDNREQRKPSSTNLGYSPTLPPPSQAREHINLGEVSVVTYEWTAVTLCLLSRLPFVRQLQQCLSFIYHRNLEPMLASWEERIRKEWRNHSQNHPQYHHDDASNNYQQSSSITTTVPTEAPLLLSGLLINNLLVALCFDSPIPRTGAFFTRINALMESTTGTHSSIMKSSSNNNNNNNNNSSNNSNTNSSNNNNNSNNVDLSVDFVLPSLEDLPICTYNICDTLFRLLGCRGVLTVLGAALRESRILLLSTDLSLLPAVCEAIRVLMYPLQWMHVYLPVVPEPLLDLMQAPVPFLLGTHTNWLSLIAPGHT